MSFVRISIACVIHLACLGGSAVLADDPKGKLPVPDETTRAKSLAEIKSVLADDYANLSKRTLAEKLLTFGQRTEKDPARRYVFFLEAGKAAIAAGDGPAICTAVDAITERYDAEDPMAMKTKGLESAAKVVTKDVAASLLAFMMEFSTKAIEADNYDSAERLVAAAKTVASRLRDTGMLRQVVAHQKEIVVLHKAYSDAAAALTKLSSQPTDPEANRIAGKYFALAKGNWDKGVPMLALGDDANLKNAATLDLALPTESDKQVGLADKWWDLSVKATGINASHLRARAAYWYEKALPEIKDEFVTAKIMKRLESIPKAPGLVESKGAGQPVKVIDLLKNVDPNTDAVAGRWIRTPTGLLSSVEQDRTCIVFPTEPTKEYELSVKAQLLGGGDNESRAFGIGLVSGGRQVCLVVNHRNRVFLEEINGRTLGPNFRFEPRKVYKYTIRVKENSIRVEIDGTKVIDWNGDSSQLSLLSRRPENMVPAGRLFLVGHRTEYLFSELTLRNLTDQQLPLPQNNNVAPLKKSTKAQIYARADDVFEMRINGTTVMSPAQIEMGVINRSIKSGDIITVQALDKQPPHRSFCCVIIPEDKSPPLTTSAGWKTYVPKSPFDWHLQKKGTSFGDPSQLQPDFRGEPVNVKTGINAMQIWGDGNPCFLVFTIP